MNYRKLRIAWSVVWGVAAVLLIALWVRSYKHGEGLLIPVRQYDGMRLASFQGRIGLEPDFRTIRWEWRIEPAFVHNADWDRWSRATPYWMFGQNNIFRVPHWFSVLVVVSLCVAPWLRRRFSLRTLLIATTLVAIVLGLIVAVV